MDDQPRNDLGALLRAWRDRLRPEAAGLPTHGHRRAKGLRREELARLASLSVDYITRLEQGRSSAPSPQVVGAIARALQLDGPETDLLHRAAGLLPPDAGLISHHVPPSIQRLAIRLGDTPVAIFAGDWTLLWFSDPWTALFPTLQDRSNLVREVFDNDTPFPPLISDDESASRFETALVADLRHVSSLHPADPQLRTLIDDLRDQSARFASLWDSGAVVAHRSETKTVRTDLAGPICLDCDVLAVPGSDLRIVVYTAAPGSKDADKLEFIRVTGLRAFQDR